MMMPKECSSTMMVPVKENPNLYRDAGTGAIINCDTTSYSQYVANLKYRNSQKQELEQLKKDIDEIKSLLKEVINGSK